MLGSAAQDYLKNIYKLQLEHEQVTPALLAARMAVSAPAVSKMLRRLQSLKLVNYTRNQHLSLTPSGEQIALEVIRHHRLLEVYLMQALGYTWDQVDEEAERLEHHISEEFEDRIDSLLGYPTHDPHGDPIPTREGHMEPPTRGTLADLSPGQGGRISRVSDDDPAMLRYMGRLGLYPNAPIRMLEQEPFGGPLLVRVAGVEHAIGRELAGHVFVTKSEE
ncbi:MAG: metal-dependent transcriptional regulator, partial [Armatimonadetes bacterium]|nr:metal-dependent transcriptional regulator [Armatimonadota bacterium]